MKGEKIRESIIAGAWYPGTEDSLRRSIRKHLDAAQTDPIQGELMGLLVPHAGYAYSGGVAAHAYKLLEGQFFDRVLIVAPSHRGAFKGASVYPLGGFRTPLGVVPLDQEFTDHLIAQTSLIRYQPEAEAQEHSLEIQLPFLQVVLGDFKLTPVLMGTQSLETCERLSEIIHRMCRGKRVLLIASTDLSHYHPYDEAKALDGVVLEKVARFDPVGLYEALKQRTCEACGGGAMVTIMLAAEKLGADLSKVLHYANSGDVTGDRSGVVGYMAAAILKAGSASSAGSEGSPEPRSTGLTGENSPLDEKQKQTLREIAMQAIRSHCLGHASDFRPHATEKLRQPRGAFVCIHKGTDLRGCIGTLEGSRPLDETVGKMAVQAAFNDPRFCALTPSELDEIEVEISVLSPLERIQDTEQIQIGKHGLWVRRGLQSGVLLPQVAVEQGWDRARFLEWACRKAGLPNDAWKDPETEIFVFTADVF